MGKTVVKFVYATEEKEGVKKPLFKSKHYTNIGYTLYENVIYKIAKLGKCEVLLFHFLCEKMDMSNNITFSAKTRTAFLDYLKKHTKLTYEDNTVKKAMSNLISVGLIITYGIRIDYTINPQHVFKGSLKERQALIQKLISEQIKSRNKNSNCLEVLGISDSI